MKAVLFATVAVVALAGAGGAAWYMMQTRDPLQQAKIALNKGDYRSAGLDLRTAVRDSPNNPEAHALFAQLLLSADDPIAAEREIKRAMELHWDPTLSQATLAQAYMRESKWKEILTETPDHGANNDQTAYFLMVRAIAQHESGDKAGAGQTIQHALTLSPQNAEVHLAAARLQFQDGNKEQALAEADRAITLDPQRVDAYQLKAVVQMAVGNRDAALATLDHAVQIAANRDDVRAQRASMLLMSNQNDKAKADVDQLMSRREPMPLAKYMRAILLIRAKKYDDADALLQQIDRFLPQLPRGLYFKALTKSETGQTAQAEDAITTFITRFPDDADAVRLLAVVELKTGHADRAIPFLVRAVSRGINDGQTLDLLGRAYALDGKQAEAKKTFARAAEQSTSPDELTRLASAQLEIGDLTGAVGDLKRAAETSSPGQTSARETLIATSIRLGELDRAQEELDSLRGDVGETEAVGILTGLLHLARLQPTEAQQSFADTVQRFPDSVAARLNDARILIQMRRYDDAVSVLKPPLDKDPARADALTLAVQALAAENKPQEAVDLAERARKAKPDDLGLINGEAQLLGRLQQFDRAIEVIETGKKSGVVPAQLLPTLGSLQFAAGKIDAAKQTFTDLVTAEPKDISAALGLADLLARTKDFAGARKSLDDAIQRQPGTLTLMQARVRIDLIDGGVDQALQTADRLQNNPANMPAAAVLKGGILLGAHRFKEATDDLRKQYLRLGTSELVVALAESEQASGDSQSATNDLKQYQTTHPDDPAIAQNLASIEIAQKQLGDAERNLQIVLRQQPNNTVALNNEAWVLQQKGDARAREYAQRAFEINPSPDVADTLGWILVGQGDSATAVGLLQSANAGAPNNPAIRYHLAVALKNTGHKQEALDVLRPAAESSLTFDEKPQAQKLMTELTQPKP